MDITSFTIIKLTRERFLKIVDHSTTGRFLIIPANFDQEIFFKCCRLEEI